jgi:hypothetical protein
MDRSYLLMLVFTAGLFLGSVTAIFLGQAWDKACDPRHETRMTFVCETLVAPDWTRLVAKARAAIANENELLMRLCLACADDEVRLIQEASAPSSQTIGRSVGQRAE